MHAAARGAGLIAYLLRVGGRGGSPFRQALHALSKFFDAADGCRKSPHLTEVSRAFFHLAFQNLAQLFVALTDDAYSLLLPRIFHYLLGGGGTSSPSSTSTFAPSAALAPSALPPGRRDALAMAPSGAILALRCAAPAGRRVS